MVDHSGHRRAWDDSLRRFGTTLTITRLVTRRSHVKIPYYYYNTNFVMGYTFVTSAEGDSQPPFPMVDHSGHRRACDDSLRRFGTTLTITCLVTRRSDASRFWRQWSASMTCHPIKWPPRSGQTDLLFYLETLKFNIITFSHFLFSQRFLSFTLFLSPSPLKNVFRESAQPLFKSIDLANSVVLVFVVFESMNRRKTCWDVGFSVFSMFLFIRFSNLPKLGFGGHLLRFGVPFGK